MTKSWHADAAHRMRELYGSRSTIKSTAVVICYRSEWAAQYIEQCPVLPLFMAVDERGRFCTKVPHPDEIHRIFAVRPKLKALMKKYHLPFPMRKLHGQVIERHYGDVFRALASMQPSALSQAIPNSRSAQLRWLRRLNEWLIRTRRGGPLGVENFPWAARELGRVPANEDCDILSIADYVRQMDDPINPSWTWANLDRASQDWHAAQFQRGGIDFAGDHGTALRFAMRDALQNGIPGTWAVPSGYASDAVLDKGDHPDAVEFQDITFVALRTPKDLAEEGYAMQHCVATYVGQVSRGYCHIVSLRRGDERVATMEMIDKRIVQIKGFRNATVSADVRDVARRYVETFCPYHPLRGRPVTMRPDLLRADELGMVVHYDADPGIMRIEVPGRRDGRTMQIEQAMSASTARLRAELERRVMDVFYGNAAELGQVYFPLLQREETPGVEAPDVFTRFDEPSN